MGELGPFDIWALSRRSRRFVPTLSGFVFTHLTGTYVSWIVWTLLRDEDFKETEAKRVTRLLTLSNLANCVMVHWSTELTDLDVVHVGDFYTWEVKNGE